MEVNNKESNSRVLTDDHSSTDDTTSTGRFYECIFCKRGFSTAQALGGHMNIHRKDRAKMKHNPPSGSKPGEDRYNPFMSSNNGIQRTFYPPVSESLKNYSTFFPVSSGDGVVAMVRPTELSLLGEDLGMRLNVLHGERRLIHDERREVGNDHGEVDLELRLGP